MAPTRHRSLSVLALFAVVLLAPVALVGQAANFDVQPLADGVYAVIRKDPPGLMVDANNVFIINDDDVVVVDANGSPAITREVLAALRRLTNKPVRTVINTHYHDDHIRGNSVYRDAFPGVAFVAHAFAKEYLPAQGATNRKSFLENGPPFVTQLRGMLAKGMSLVGGDLSDEERTTMTNDIALADLVLKDGAAAETVLPTVTVTDRLTLTRGGRTIEILHVGKGHTAADLIIHLPRERIVVTGDLVVWPVPLVGDTQSHIGTWPAALDAIRALKPAMIVPGHGPVLREDRHLAAIGPMFASIRKQTGEAVARGESLDAARKSVKLDEFQAQLAGESRVRQLLFSVYVARPAVTAAFREAGGK